MTLSFARPPAYGCGQAPRSAAAVPSAGTTRRLRALAFMGHSAGALAARLALADYAVRRLQSGQPAEVPAALAAAVAAVYDDLWDVRGPSARSARVAIRRGFVPALAWDDNPGDPHFIDDPAASPAPNWRPRRRLSPAQRGEEITELLSLGFTPAGAARRLGITSTALRQRIRRARTAEGGSTDADTTV